MRLTLLVSWMCLFPRQTRTSVSFMIQRAASVSSLLEMTRLSSSLAKFDLSNSIRRVFHTSTLMMGAPSATQIQSSKQMTPSILISRPKRSLIFIKFDVGNVVMVTGGGTEVVLGSSRTEKNI